MVLEISATPYIFTFKLWDWGRLGLDGKPRPIHLEHGVANIQWDRTTGWVRAQPGQPHRSRSRSGDGWREERTGLHEREFIETRRHWFTERRAPRHARRRQCAEPGRRRGGAGRKPGRRFRAVCGPLRRDVHRPCRRRAFYRPSARPLFRVRMRDHQGQCQAAEERFLVTRRQCTGIIVQTFGRPAATL